MWLDRIDAHTKNTTVHTYMYINRWIIPTVYITDLGRLAEIIDHEYLLKSAGK
jgi:hypothetical protein